LSSSPSSSSLSSSSLPDSSSSSSLVNLSPILHSNHFNLETNISALTPHVPISPLLSSSFFPVTAANPYTLTQVRIDGTADGDVIVRWNYSNLWKDC
jgi:hypothetical protein